MTNNKGGTRMPQINNEAYNDQAESWWSDNGFLALLRYFNNVWRLPYYQRILTQQFETPEGKRLLDVGCGGGVLAEQFAAMGFAVTGIDPSDKSIEVAQTHAAQNGFKIDYLIGYGNKMPFENETFDVVVCSDVLEHIEKWDEVIGEVARVLKSNGIFIYATINRTTSSKAGVIEAWQENDSTSYMPPNLHVWEMFIKPEELEKSLEKYGLQNREIKGIKPLDDPALVPIAMQQHKEGRISSFELIQRTYGGEGSNIDIYYKGYAVKP